MTELNQENLPVEPAMASTPEINTPEDHLENVSTEGADLEHLEHGIDEDHDEPLQDFSSLGKEELAELAEKTSKTDQWREGTNTFRAIKPLFDQLIQKEQQAALEKFLEEGNNKDDFEPKPDPLKDRFYEAYRQFGARKNQYRDNLEDQKKKNLELKREILNKIKVLAEGDETQESLTQLKELQAQWKAIRAIPREYVEELWESYRVHIERFYDKLSQFNELKQLDREKNLELKVELIKKVTELSQESSITKSLILLNKYHEEWKNTGPAPKDHNEELWKRFKQASDGLFQEKKAQIEEIQKTRTLNLQAKTELCEQLENIAKESPAKAREWVERSKQITDLQEQWRKIGTVPKEFNKQIWARFRAACDLFYANKNTFFKELNKAYAENLKKKNELCEQAEALLSAENWQKATNELKKLQEEWKAVGPVSEKVSDKVWKRFRAACDSFFERKAEFFKEKVGEQQENLEKKKALLEQLEQLAAAPASQDTIAAVRTLQEQWNQVGFVPVKEKDGIQKKYNTLLDKLYGQAREQRQQDYAGKNREALENLSSHPDGKRKLDAERRHIRERIKNLQANVDTWQTNIEFFGRSKNADEIRKEFEGKIKNTQQQITELKDRLKVIATLMEQ